jgi:CDP-L-myo-inositol myo-inositolphosphotransferase
MDGATAGARRRAGWSILQRSAKSTDGWIARHFNRPISRLVSYALLTMRLRADHASVLTLLVGIAAALVATRPGYLPFLVTGVLFHLASVLDGVDGEMARATFTESERGARLDAIVDQVTYLVCFVGIVVGWGREGLGPTVLFWGAIIATALVLSLLRGARFVSKYAPNASFVFIDRSIRRAAHESGRWPLRFAAAAFLLLRRDLFAVIFLGASLTGRRVLVPALVVGGITLANVTLTRYRGELEAAALLENPQVSRKAG